MKKIIAKIALLIFSVIFIIPFFVACGDKEPPEKCWFAIFKDNYGNEYRANGFNYIELRIGHEYDEEKEYCYTMTVYDRWRTRIDSFTSKYLNGADTGKHLLIYEWVTAAGSSPMSCALYVTISDKPDTQYITPEVYFDLRGATIESEGDDLKYVYMLDSYLFDYPLLHLRYEGEEIKISDKATGVAGWSFKGKKDINYGLHPPATKGEFWYYYDVDYSGYLLKEDKAKFKEVHICITVEIRE